MVVITTFKDEETEARGDETACSRFHRLLCDRAWSTGLELRPLPPESVSSVSRCADHRLLTTTQPEMYLVGSGEAGIHNGPLRRSSPDLACGVQVRSKGNGKPQRNPPISVSEMTLGPVGGGPPSPGWELHTNQQCFKGRQRWQQAAAGMLRNQGPQEGFKVLPRCGGRPQGSGTASPWTLDLNSPPQPKQPGLPVSPKASPQELIC